MGRQFQLAWLALGLTIVLAAVFVVSGGKDARADIAAERCAAKSNCCDTLVTSACTLPAFTRHKAALVIGVKNYENLLPNILKPLNNPNNDAMDLGAALEELGFDVRYLLDPTQTAAFAAIKRLAAHLGDVENELSATGADSTSERAILTFSGHGFRLDGQDFLVFRPDPNAPQSPNLKEARIATTAIAKFFSGLRFYDVTFVFDACRNLPYLPNASGVSTRGGTYENRYLEGAGVTQFVTAFSTTGGFPAADDLPARGYVNNSPYAGNLTYFLKRHGLNLATTFSLTGYSVALDSDQTPTAETGTAPIASAAYGDAILRPTPVGNQCALLDSAIWNLLASCKPFGYPSCIQRVCKEVWKPHVKSANDYSCLGQETFSRVGDLPTICAKLPAQATPISVDAQQLTKLGPAPAGKIQYDPASDFALIDSPTLDEGTLSQLAFVAKAAATSAASVPQVTAAEYWQLPQVTANKFKKIIDKKVYVPDVSLENLLAVNENKKAGRSFEDISRDILSKAPAKSTTRDAMISSKPRFDSGIPLDTKGVSSFYLRKSPLFEDEGPIFTELPSRAHARLDCVNNACGDGWAGVSVTLDGSLYRGFLRTSDLPKVTEGVVLEVAFENGSTGLTKESGAKLQKAISGLKGTVNAVSMTLFQSNAEDVRPSLMTSARASFLTAALVEQGRVKGIRSDGVSKAVALASSTNSSDKAIIRFASVAPGER